MIFGLLLLSPVSLGWGWATGGAKLLKLITVGVAMQGVEYGIDGMASKAGGESQISVYSGKGSTDDGTHENNNVTIFVSLGAVVLIAVIMMVIIYCTMRKDVDLHSRYYYDRMNYC